LWYALLFTRICFITSSKLLSGSTQLCLIHLQQFFCKMMQIVVYIREANHIWEAIIVNNCVKYTISLKPPRKKQKIKEGYKEDPFILLTKDDEQWQGIQ
jgi:hypothetical protein